MKRLLCWIGAHDLHAECEGREAEGPPPKHICRPKKGDSVMMISRRFHVWTMLKCTRCGFIPKCCRETVSLDHMLKGKL